MSEKELAQRLYSTLVAREWIHEEIKEMLKTPDAIGELFKCHWVKHRSGLNITFSSVDIANQWSLAKLRLVSDFLILLEKQIQLDKKDLAK